MTNVDPGSAERDVRVDSSGAARVIVSRDYRAGLVPSTSERVWQLVSDFTGVKVLFPSLLSVYVTYPNPTDAKVGTVRHMSFAPLDPTTPLSSTNPLAAGIETLVELNLEARRVTYTSSLGLPVSNYRSTMEVTGADACRLTWVSSFEVSPGDEGVAEVIAGILVSGANQIATELGLD